MSFLTAFALPATALAVYLAYTYNRFISLRQRLANAAADVDVQLKRRWDLVPPLVETVRGYAGHEHEVFAAVAQARSEARARDAGNGDLAGRGGAEQALAANLRQLFAVAESYPALRADTNFLALHESLVAIEDDLQHARRYHNAVVRDLNTLRQSVPAGFVGAAAGFGTAGFFQLDADERAVPAVAFGRDPEEAP